MNITKQDIDFLNVAIDKQVDIVAEVIDKIVSEYTSNLDKIMLEVKHNVIERQPAPINELEKYFLELSTEIYFISSNTEKLGMYDYVSKLKAQETYNDAYLKYIEDGASAKKKPTVAELTALAEKDSTEDNVMHDIYMRAYKIIKNKVSSAELIVSSLSKILTSRLQESQMNTDRVERQLLNNQEI